MEIKDYRDRIDAIDRQLLQLFNERAAMALEIGHIKQGLKLPIYDPAREKRIFQRMQQENPGPLEDSAIVRLFERVVDESRRLERLRSRGDEEC